MSFWNVEESYANKEHDEFVNKVIAGFKEQTWYNFFVKSMKCNLKRVNAAINIISHDFPMYRIFNEDTSQTSLFKINYSTYLLNFVPFISNNSFSKYIWKLRVEERIIILEYLILLSHDLIIPQNYQCDGCTNCKGCVKCVQCKNCYLCSNCVECNACRFCDKCEHCDYLDSCDCCSNSKQCTRTLDCKKCEQCCDCRGIRNCKHSIKLYECKNIVNAFDLKREKDIDAKKTFKTKLIHNVIQNCGSCNKKICRSYTMICCRRSICVDCYNDAMKRRIFFCPNCKRGHFIN